MRDTQVPIKPWHVEGLLTDIVENGVKDAFEALLRVSMEELLAGLPVNATFDPQFNQHVARHEGFDGPVYLPEVARDPVTGKLKSSGYSTYIAPVWRFTTATVEVDPAHVRALPENVKEAVSGMPKALSDAVEERLGLLRANPQVPSPSEIVFGLLEVAVDREGFKFKITASVTAAFLPPQPVTPDRRTTVKDESASQVSESNPQGQMGCGEA
jgi:hypothetical protein